MRGNNKCRVCGKHPLTGKDYFILCRKCQPAWQAGRREGLLQAAEKIRSALSGWV
jgi:hypothetical protein